MNFNHDLRNIFSLISKDGQLTNINFVDPRLENAEVTSDFLDIIYVGRCALDEAQCSLHAGDITGRYTK